MPKVPIYTFMLMQSEPTVNVLLVDDHPENLVALEAILESDGRNLVKANSGQEALRCLLNQDFAVILLDVQMPELDGFETARLIRSRERSRNTPIIFLTAFGENNTQMFKGYEIGAVDFLLKPLDPTILASKVAVFVDLFKKTLEIQRQTIQLAAMNAELRRSEERFRTLSACAPIGIFLTDTEGRCTYTNPNCQALCGFRLEESWQSGWARVIHPADHDRVLTCWSGATRSGQAYSEEFRIYTVGDMVRWVRVQTSPMLTETHQLMGHVGTIEDITERREAEAVREQMIREQAARQEAEAANRMKDEFLAIVSHELRTPLNSILGWSRLLLTKQFEPETQLRAMETIERNARSQAQLIDDILDISRLIQGKLRLNLQPVNLVTLIESVLETLCPLAAGKELQMEANLDPAVSRICADPERIRQIVLNLLSNAIKFTPEGGQVTVNLSLVPAQEAVETAALHPPLRYAANPSVTLKPETAYAQLQIIDTGIGISPEFLPYVFDRFRQADSSTSRVHGGLGLGLAIAGQLVNLHGGKIYADSAGEGQGATFTVRLPLAADTLESCSVNTPFWVGGDEPEQRSSFPLNQVQVLVVEDSPDSRDFIQTVLEQSGASVTTVTSASEAMQVLEQSIPDVLISDIGMPEEDGYTFIRRVRLFEQAQGKTIPAIAVTAYTRPEDALEALSAGFQLHVAKPIEPLKLLAAVAQLVRQKVVADRA